ncbi:transposase [Vibrio chagasii]|nr:transposase [Vibrio chagasii]
MVPSVKWEGLGVNSSWMSSLSLKDIGMPRPVADAKTHQVILDRLGRSRADIRPFFELLGKHGNNIEAVAMDMNTAFES